MSTTISYFKTEDVILNFTGVKAQELLHGQLTNDIKSLALNQGNFNLLLNRKGKVCASLYVLRREDGCQILVRQDLSSVLLEHFRMLAPLSRVQIDDLSERIAVYHVQNADQIQRLAFQKFQVRTDFFSNFVTFRSDRLGVPGYDVLVPIERQVEFLDFTEKHCICNLSQKDVDLIRIRNGVPRCGVDVTDENLPQEARLDEALHFKKGCYLGQEVIARLHFRGHVNRVLQVFESNQEIRVGDNVAGDSDKKRIVTSAAYDAVAKKYYYLAYAPVAQKDNV